MDLKLSVVLSLIEKATAPLKSITGQATQSAKALRDTRQRLKELEKTQGVVNGFRAASRATKGLATDLKAARDRAEAAGKAIGSTGMATRAQVKEFTRLRGEVKTAERAFTDNAAKIRRMREQLSAAGIDTKNLGSAQRNLASQIGATNAQLSEQQKRAAAVGAQQQRMNAARGQLHSAQALAGNIALAGGASMVAGERILGGMRPAIDEAKAFQQQVAQLRAQGIGDAAVTDAQKYARSMDVIGSSATDNLKLLKEANSVLRDMHEAEEVTPYLARMKFGIEAVMAQGGHGEGHGEHAEAMFMDLLKVAELRGAAKNPESLKRVLDFSTQAYVASGGLVKPEDLLNMIKTGGVAAKQLDDKSFFFGLLHTMQEMGGHRAGTGLATAYQNFAAGRTTQQSAEELKSLGLLKDNAVLYGTTGHVKKLLPDPLKDAELYRNNPFEFLMTRIVPKVNPAGALNDQQVVSKINALFSGRKGGDLFASLFMERANIAKHMAAAPKAYGVDALYREAGGTAGGQELDLDAKKRDLYRELGMQVLPLYVAGLTKLVSVVKALTGFTERHPILAKTFMVGAAGMGALMTAAGGLMLTIGALVGQFALLRFAMKAAGIRFGGAAAASGAEAATGGAGAAARAGLLSRVATGARGALAAIAAIPVGVLAIIAVLVVAALVVRKYWGPISAWFQGIGQGISQAVAPALSRLGEALGPIGQAFGVIVGWLGAAWQWFTQLLEPVNATAQQLDGARSAGASFGTVIGAVLASAIDMVTRGVHMFVAIGEAIGNAAGWAVTSWGPLTDFFAGIWASVKNGAATALNWIHEKIDAVRAVIEHLYALWQKLPGTGTAAPQPLDWIMPGDADKARRAADAMARNPMGSPGTASSPIGTPARIGASQAAGATYHVSVDARGMHPDQVQQAVGQALQQHERKNAARTRSAFSDED